MQPATNTDRPYYCQASGSAWYWSRDLAAGLPLYYADERPAVIAALLCWACDYRLPHEVKRRLRSVDGARLLALTLDGEVRERSLQLIAYVCGFVSDRDCFGNVAESADTDEDPCSHCGDMTLAVLLEDCSEYVGRLSACCPVCVAGIEDEQAEELRDEPECNVVLGFVGGK